MPSLSQGTSSLQVPPSSGIASQFKPLSYPTNIGMTLKDTLSQKQDDNVSASMNNSVMSMKEEPL